jgi:hypothetical protein
MDEETKKTALGRNDRFPLPFSRIRCAGERGQRASAAAPTSKANVSDGRARDEHNRAFRSMAPSMAEAKIKISVLTLTDL